MERKSRVAKWGRAVGAGVLALAALSMVAAPSGARGATHAAVTAAPVTFSFDGTLSGTGSILEPLNCGQDLSVVNDGTISLTAGGQATFHANYCVTAFAPAVVSVPIYGGTFTITTGDGTVSGTVSGTSETANQTRNGFPVHWCSPRRAALVGSTAEPAPSCSMGSPASGPA